MRSPSASTPAVISPPPNTALLSPSESSPGMTVAGSAPPMTPAMLSRSVPFGDPFSQAIHEHPHEHEHEHDDHHDAPVRQVGFQPVDPKAQVARAEPAAPRKDSVGTMVPGGWGSGHQTGAARRSEPAVQVSPPRDSLEVPIEARPGRSRRMSEGQGGRKRGVSPVSQVSLVEVDSRLMRHIAEQMGEHILRGHQHF